ncbi:hypothetical protein F7661_09675 [Pseudomonas sp. CFA]|nr:hypothetical protein F7661_09675 [Pseudomonas sp. CFA]
MPALMSVSNPAVMMTLAVLVMPANHAPAAGRTMNKEIEQLLAVENALPRILLGHLIWRVEVKP